jgi:hypothetical protein
MGMIRFQGDAVEVDASVIAEALGSTAGEVRDRMRRGEIIGRCERGVDVDAGRYRLTFTAGRRRFRIVIDEAGNVVQRSTVNFAAEPAARRHRP